MLTLLNELAPCRRQLQHPQGMAGRCRIEDDVVVLAAYSLISEEMSKLIEGRNFDSTRAGQLLFHIAQGRLRQEAAIRTNDTFPIAAAA